MTKQEQALQEIADIVLKYHNLNGDSPAANHCRNIALEALAASREEGKKGAGTWVKFTKDDRPKNGKYLVRHSIENWRAFLWVSEMYEGLEYLDESPTSPTPGNSERMEKEAIGFLEWSESWGWEVDRIMGGEKYWIKKDIDYYSSETASLLTTKQVYAEYKKQKP